MDVIDTDAIGTGAISTDATDADAIDTDAIATIAASIAHHVRQNHPPHRCPALRDAHPKHHGCVRAEFVIEPDSPELAHFRHGVFARPGDTYHCWVRFSNALKNRHDLAPDARGMAVKLMGIEKSESASGTQDFLMVSHRVFFARDANEFVDFPATVSAPSFSPRMAWSILGYFIDLKRRRLRLRALFALLTATELTWSPLAVKYYSQTPYKLGPDNLMKYRVRPHEPRPLWRLIAIGFRVMAYMITSPFGGAKTSFNMLHDALVRRLKRGEVRFDFEVQMRDAREAEKNNAVDDPIAAWSEREFPFRKVAEIRIAPLRTAFSEADENTMMELGQHLSFTPWHAVRGHQPVGSINKARRVVYERISRLRHELNGKLRKEPREDQSPEEYLKSIVPVR
jgi:catalase